MIIDAHQHFWNFSAVAYRWPTAAEAPIYRDIEAPELAGLLAEAGVDRTVAVQADNSYADTEYLLATAHAHPFVAGVVGWVPLDRPDEAARKLEEFGRDPRFRGVRHLIHNEPDPNWVVREEVLEGLRALAAAGFPFDVVAEYPLHLEHVPLISERVPGLRMVIDHLAKPPIRERRRAGWIEQLTAAAENPNVFAKISGLNTAAHRERWRAEDLQPYIDDALRLFGPQRLMFGSDWPVANLAGDYLKVWRESNRALAGCSPEERAAIFGGTAARFYRLDPA